MIQDLYKQKRSLELKWEQEYLGNNRYTLEMVRIDDKVKEVITRSSWKKQLLPIDRILLKVQLHKFQ